MENSEKKDLVVLGVAAHPDDLDAGAAGSFAKWAKEGAKCYYLILTDGGRGSMDPNVTADRLVEMRREEQRAAGKIIGLTDVFFLDYKDTELAVTKELKKDIVYYIRKLKADVVVTTDPSSIYFKRGFINHTDHRAAGTATIDAIYPLAKNAFAFKEFETEGIKPHKVKTLYLMSFGEGSEIVDITDTIDLKVRAVAEHKSQALSGMADFFKQMSGMMGEKAGYKYAEAFTKIEMR